MAERTLQVLNTIRAYASYCRRGRFDVAIDLLREAQLALPTYYRIVVGSIETGLLPHPGENQLAYQLLLRRWRAYVGLLQADAPEEMIERAYSGIFQPA